MVSKWMLGALALAGVVAGFALAGPPRANGPTLSSAIEVEQLYHNEVALNAQETHLQQLLGFSRAELARAHAAPAPAPATAKSPSPSPQGVLVASPASPTLAPTHAASAPTASPTTTTTTAPPTTTTTTTSTTVPPPTTTTTVPPTTTTTPRHGDDGGGSDD